MELTQGLLAAGRGLRVAASLHQVRRAYVWLVIVFTVLTVVFDGFGFWFVARTVVANADASWGLELLFRLLRFASFLAVLLVAPLLAWIASKVAFSFVAEQVFLAGFRAVDPKRATELAARTGAPFWTVLARLGLRALFFAGVSIVWFGMALIPIVGPLLLPVLQVYWTARALSWELLDPYFEKLNYGFSEQRRFVNRHRWRLVGFGLPWLAIMSIPLLGPLLVGFAQASVGVLLAELLNEAEGA